MFLSPDVIEVEFSGEIPSLHQKKLVYAKNNETFSILLLDRKIEVEKFLPSLVDFLNRFTIEASIVITEKLEEYNLIRSLLKIETIKTLKIETI